MTDSASMRPPEFTGGNRCTRPTASQPGSSRFNEAAGIHRRKPTARRPVIACAMPSFNEAAGIHRRKPPYVRNSPRSAILASMRPPEFTGGNCDPRRAGATPGSALQ